MSTPELPALRILSLEGSDIDEELIRRELTKGRVACVWKRVETAVDFEQALAEFQPGIILSDYRLPSFDGGQALTIARARSPDVPLIVISGAVGEETAVDLLKNGATDFVLKDRLTRLVPAVHRALREVEERRARQQAEADLRALNEQLEARVTERTRELSKKNDAMEEDLRMARELQLALLPQRFPTLPRGAAQAVSAVKFCSIFHPASSVSGDFFNVVRVSETAVGVFICDVMGHGVRAALVTAMMRALEEQLGDAADNPGALLTEINRGLSSILRQSEVTLFATACYLIADIATSRISYANAGHPSPVLVRRASDGVVPLSPPHTGGPALGIFPDAQYQTQQHPVAADDLILLFTDGLFEVENASAEAYGEGRLHESIRRRAGQPPAQLVQSLFTEVESFAEGRVFADDVCLVGMEIVRLDGRSS
ncbi:MAG: PP2C family protein-serine/threonine phosphatase [Verrucomicrobiales bacterium]